MQKFAKEVRALPAALQQYVLSGVWEDKTQEIGARYQLSDEQIYQLQVEVALVLVGLERPGDFGLNTEPILPTNTPGNIMEEIQAEIFQPILTDLARYNSYLDEQDKIMDERLKNLPEGMRQSLRSLNTEQVVQEIGQKHALHVDQMGRLNEEMWRVVTGETKATDFANKISQATNIGGSEAEQIAGEISNRIFIPIREAMKAVDERQGTPSPEELLREIEHTTAPKAPVPEPETPTSTPLGAGSLLERKLSETVSMKPSEQVIEGQPDLPVDSSGSESVIKHTDPYREPLE